jgi:hypothetical protein
LLLFCALLLSAYRETQQLSQQQLMERPLQAMQQEV